MRNFKHTAAAHQVGAAVLAALLVGSAATTVAPAPNSAIAAESGQIRVDLRAAVGEEWFSKIGDREVKLELVSDALPTPDQLQNLDIPKIKRDNPEQLKTVATATTKDGAAEFTGLATGVYLVSVADSADPADKRVSYSPFVVAVTPSNQNQTVAPKAQEVGITVDPLTTCSTPQWRDAAAPGSYVEYDFVSTVPNLSKDGTLGKYELTLQFSPGHTVQWNEGNTRSVIALGATPQAGHEGGPRTFIAAAGKVQVLAEGEVARKKAPVDKLEALRLTVRGAGENVQLTRGEDYVETQHGNDSATFELTESGLRTLARLKELDAATTVDTWVPAKANEQGPWGSGPVRDAVLGDLAATATLLTDGMDAARTPISVEHTNHINVVDRPKCFGPADATTTETAPTTTKGRPGIIPIPLPIPLPGGGSSKGAAATTTVTEVVTHETSGADGAKATVTETVTRQAGPGSDGGAGSGSGAGAGAGSGAGSGASGQRSGGLAYTGASVIGVTLIAALLIVLGLWLRRRDKDEDQG